MGKDFRLEYFKENFEPDFDSYILIEANSEGDNTIYYDPATERFIKFLYPVVDSAEYTKRYEQMRREIIIGTFLHTMDSKHFVDIIGYVTFDCGAVSKSKANSLCEGIISRKVSGMNYAKFLTLVTPAGFKQFMITFFRFLLKMYSNYKFVHNDLHTGNFFIGLDSSGYYPILLDFGNSTIEIPYSEFCSEHPDSRICNLYEKPIETLRISHVDPFTPFLINDFNTLIQLDFRPNVGFLYSVNFFINYMSIYREILLSIYELQLQGPQYAKFAELGDKISSIEDFNDYMKSNMDIIQLIEMTYKQTPPHQSLNFEKNIRALEGVTTTQIENLKRIQKYLRYVSDEYNTFLNLTPTEESNLDKGYVWLLKEKMDSLDLNVFIDWCERFKI